MTPESNKGETTERFLNEHCNPPTIDWLKNLAHRYAGDQAAKIDPSQVAVDVLVKALQRRHQLHPEATRVRAWMRKVLVRDVMHKLMLASSKTQAFDENALLEKGGATGKLGQPLNEQELEKLEARNHLSELLKQMSEQDQELICLHWLEEMPNEHLANLLSISEQTLRQRYTRALKRLRLLADKAGL